jgi:phosphate/sulfate permease
MNLVRLLMYGVVACVLALAGFLYAIGAASNGAGQKSATVGESSPWPAVLLAAVVVVAGITVQHHLVARPNKRPSVQDKLLDTASLIAIVAICGLGMLVSLWAEIYGWDINPGVTWDR